MSKHINKHIIILLLSTFILASCRTKKKTFNGTATLPCPEHNIKNTDKKKKSKWRLILYKDGERVIGKSKRGKSRLFKK
tara:strand:- start:141 stop:377 length:237 start_codon:yes stop_codon:yes gene_type:complete